ncbi:MAG TPA: potassium-transporting ATPase subunit C [Thermoplasmata archaeon]|jgi:potassium-transporting ATPase KdpC subunit|nr:potassium-transporting ATPase subunit C [Thermoplasmata archaeon]
MNGSIDGSLSLDPTVDPGATAPVPPRAHSGGGHVRATAVFLVLMIVLVGLVYPFTTTAVAQLIDPHSANGSLLYYPNGTLAGSELIAQNTSAPFLFWERPSGTDYNTTLGVATDPGPTDPALLALLNETIAYMKEYGNFTVNATLPFWWVAPSASSVDPDLTPEAVLVQVPRVAEANNLTVADVTGLVNAHITQPLVPFLGVAYVNVLELDLALVGITGRT